MIFNLAQNGFNICISLLWSCAVFEFKLDTITKKKQKNKKNKTKQQQQQQKHTRF